MVWAHGRGDIVSVEGVGRPGNRTGGIFPDVSRPGQGNDRVAKALIWHGIATEFGLLWPKPTWGNVMRLAHAILGASLALATPAPAETTLRIMSYNIWGGGGNEAKGIAETLVVLRAANPDIIGMQETMLEADPCTAESCPPNGKSVAKEIAEALGFFHYDQPAAMTGTWANAILSRYPIGAATPNGLGAPIEVNGTDVWLFNLHHDDEPYQPYQLLEIPYGPAPFITTEVEAVDWAEKTRGPAMAALEADMSQAAGALVIVTGDFNEPSSLDWTEATVIAGHQPIAVAWPASQRLTDAGFIDAYRAIYPGPVAKPAYTWTPRYDEKAVDDHPDRIDFVLVKGPGVTEAAIVGETGPRTDLAVDPWPSDHRAVLAGDPVLTTAPGHGQVGINC